MLEGFLSAINFAIKDVREGVNGPMSSCYLVAVLVNSIAIAYFPTSSVLLFRSI